MDVPAPLKSIQEASQALDKRDWEGFKRAHTEDCVVYGAGVIDTRGSDGLRVVFDMWVGPFPDLKQELVDVVVGEDSAFAEIEISGTHTGPLPTGEGPALAPTGRSFTTRMAALFKTQGGKISEVHEFINFAHILEQLGAGQSPSS